MRQRAAQTQEEEEPAAVTYCADPVGPYRTVPDGTTSPGPSETRPGSVWAPPVVVVPYGRYSTARKTIPDQAACGRGTDLEVRTLHGPGSPDSARNQDARRRRAGGKNRPADDFIIMLYIYIFFF